MSAFDNLGGLTLTSDSKHAGVESITMAMARTPCQYQGPAGPSCPALSSRVCVSPKVPTGQVFLAAPEALTSEVSLAPGPIKRALKESFRGEVMGCNYLTVWEDIITGTGQTQPNYKELYK